MAQSDTLLELRDVDFAYGERLILSKLSMRIPVGSNVLPLRSFFFCSVKANRFFL